MTNGCRGCIYLSSAFLGGESRFCDYAGKTGKTRRSQGVKTEPGGGCSLKKEKGTGTMAPVRIAYGRTVRAPRLQRRRT